MSVNSPDLFVTEFANTIEMLTQQKLSKLSHAVTIGGGHHGSQASPVDQIGLIEVAENAERFAPMPRTDAPYARRWVFPTNWDLNQLKDPNDLVRQMVDDKAVMANAAVAAMNRRRDRTIIADMIGTNYTGQAGTTATALPSSQVISVDVGGAASRFNVAKARAAFELFMTNEVDMDTEELYCALDSKAYSSLLSDVQVTSKDFNEGDAVISNGRLRQIFGMNIIPCQRLVEFNGTDDQGGTSTPILCWAKSKVYLGNWRDMTIDVSPRKDLRAIPWQLYMQASFGATRLEEVGVIKVWSRP